MVNSSDALTAAARELEALRAELDVRLAALEHALAHPEPGTSLERLVIDLARVATAEAEAAAARAVLEAQRQSRQDAALAVTAAQASLDAERANVQSLRHDLERARSALGRERESGAQLRRELDLERSELQVAIDADAAQRGRIDELERALARESDADGEHRRVAAELDETRARLERTTAELRGMTAQLEAAGIQFEAEQRRAGEALTAAAARTAAAEVERDEADRGRREAEDRADQAYADRDELTLMLDASKQAIQGMNAAVDERLAAIDARRARALQAAEERAEAAVREREAMALERDTLAARLAEIPATPTPAPPDDGDAAQRLEAAIARIHALELQLFERERGPSDLDVDLGSLLPAAPATPARPIDRAATPATRYGFKPPRKVRIDREGGLLLDLSVSGAQVICATAPEVGRVVTLTLLSSESPCFCQGRLLWARREQTAKGRPYRYPAGIAFTEIDERAVRAFIDRHAAGRGDEM